MRDASSNVVIPYFQGITQEFCHFCMVLFPH